MFALSFSLRSERLKKASFVRQTNFPRNWKLELWKLTFVLKQSFILTKSNDLFSYYLLFDLKSDKGSYLTIFTAQKMKFSIKGFFSNCDQIRRFSVDLVAFTEETLNGKRHFCAVFWFPNTHLYYLKFLLYVASHVESI